MRYPCSHLAAALFVLHSLFIHDAMGAGAEKELFRHSTRADFRTGTLSNAGQNLYVRADGSLRLIHQFDFNNDGVPDILVLNDHNHFDTPPMLLYKNRGKDGFQSLMPPLWKDMPLFQVLEHYTKQRQQETFLPALGGVAATVGDFNGDGIPDIALSNFVHGWNLTTFPLSIYWGSNEGFQPENRALLDGYFSAGMTAADLDNDGIVDLVVACRGPEYEAASGQKLPLEERRQKISKRANHSSIVYGSKDWSATPRTLELPTLYSIDSLVYDLNGDGKADIIFLEAGDPGLIRIYLASDEGYKPQEIVVGDPLWEVIRSRKLHLADLNNDGAPDLIVPERSGLRILWNDGKGGFSADRFTLLDIKNSYASATGDFNGNGKLDLVIAVGDSSTENSPSVILTNNGGSIETWERTLIPGLLANAVTVADLNGDGYDDVVLANYQNSAEESLDTDSYIYWGSANGISPQSRTDLATFGAVDVKTVPSRTTPGGKDLLFVNRQSGKRGVSSVGPTDSGGMPSYVYWGNKAASYSPASMTRFAAPTSETSAVACDLQGNGKADLILLTHRGGKVGIYTLKEGQYTLFKEWDLPERGKVPLIADFDKDGTLDLLVIANDLPEAYLYHDILHRGEKPETIKLPAVGYSAALADLDGDGYLDLINVGVGNVFVVYGNEKGLDVNRTLLIPQDKFFAKVAVADLDKDGALDVVAFAWNEPSTGNNKTDSVIFWNRDGKISAENVSPLATLGGASQGTIMDINGDGFLDIISSNYHGGDDRHMDVQVFLGDGTRTFSRDRSWNVPGFSSAANQVLDFNKDGFMDLLVFNHSESTENVEGKLRGGMHSTGAWLYWGGKDGFSTSRRSWIPTYGPHNKINVDPGDIANRRPMESFTSAPIALAKKQRNGEFTLKLKTSPSASGFIKAKVKLLASGKEGATWSEQGLPLASNENGLLTYGPVAIKEAESLIYHVELHTGFLGTAPAIHEVRGVLNSK